MRTGNIERVTLRDLLDSFNILHPGAPPSLKSVILRPLWLEAVRENDISRLVLISCGGRSRLVVPKEIH